jgi:aspartate aminotransferase
LQEEDVGVAPGYTFGPGNDQHVRICFARRHDQLREGLQRMLRYLDKV